MAVHSAKPLPLSSRCRCSLRTLPMLRLRSVCVCSFVVAVAATAVSLGIGAPSGATPHPAWVLVPASMLQRRHTHTQQWCKWSWPGLQHSGGLFAGIIATCSSRAALAVVNCASCARDSMQATITSAAPFGRYPQLDLEAFSGQVEVLNHEPPMWFIRDFISREDCEALILEGREEKRPKKIYQGSDVVFDEKRLQPLVLVPPLCSCGSLLFNDGDPVAGVLALCVAAATVLLLKQVVRWCYSKILAAGGKGGARFLGSKWQLGPPLEPKSPMTRAAAEGPRERLLERVQRLCQLPNVKYLEPPFLTRYRSGEGQSAHVDSRSRPGPEATDEERAAFKALGGQRMVQCLCYLNDVDINLHGGATCFQEAMGNLRVKPEAGSALVFCTAFADGQEDMRMVHSAEAIKDPTGRTEKWIVPVWSLEGEHADWQQWM
eukprot:TRINITY_DN93945_c0_g1_i1.p1 TRINITY_DN93945_c0_g1~~TRINITY_DN93945_c0_g1_i1.p1  ORF type:complete len:470 (+),score=69.01 TRINITY_DN93945_c0_g1_i1:112-1410(+)